MKGPLLSRVCRYLRTAVLEPLRSQGPGGQAGEGTSKPPPVMERMATSVKPAPSVTATVTASSGPSDGVNGEAVARAHTAAATASPGEGEKEGEGGEGRATADAGGGGRGDVRGGESLAARARALRQARVRSCIQIVSRTGEGPKGGRIRERARWRHDQMEQYESWERKEGSGLLS